MDGRLEPVEHRSLAVRMAPHVRLLPAPRTAESAAALLDTAQGIDSRIVVVQDQSESRLGAAWLRTLRATGQTIYSGCIARRLCRSRVAEPPLCFRCRTAM